MFLVMLFELLLNYVTFSILNMFSMDISLRMDCIATFKLLDINHRLYTVHVVFDVEASETDVVS